VTDWLQSLWVGSGDIGDGHRGTSRTAEAWSECLE
jgi:hypothetical protein